MSRICHSTGGLQRADYFKPNAGRKTTDYADGRIEFATIAGRSYRVERTDDLTAPAVWTVVADADSVAGTGGLVQVTDAGAGGAAPRFYRVQLLP